MEDDDMTNESLYYRVDMIIDTVELTKHFWKTDELKQEAADILSWGEGIKDCITEGAGRIDYEEFKKASFKFTEKVLQKPITH
jgi:hypothetical protein